MGYGEAPSGTLSTRLAAVIAEQAAQRNLSVEDLAAAAGLSRATAYRRVRDGLVRTDELERIATALDVRASDLLDLATAKAAS